LHAVASFIFSGSFLCPLAAARQIQPFGGCMSGRSGSSFGKLQKERARREKQLEKAARKKQRKLEKQAPQPSEYDPQDVLHQDPATTLPDHAPSIPALSEQPEGAQPPDFGKKY
jgi:hypothetical protein